MANQQLIDYIRQAQARGYQKDAIRQSLLKSGWQQLDVDDAFYALGQSGGYMQPSAPQQPAQPKERSKRPKAILGIGILNIILAVLSILGGLLITILPLLFGSMVAGFAGAIGGASAAASAAAATTTMMVLGIVTLGVGIATLIASILLLRMRRSGMIATVVLGIISIVLNICSNFPSKLASPNTLVPIIITALIIAYVLVKRKLFA
jgi:hypothetical protein